MRWWSEGLLVRVRLRPEGLVLALLYALACWGARAISLDQFYLPAGVRVAALLLCPPRLWPYLLAGEYAYFTHLRMPLRDTYGLAWVISASALLMPAVMLIVRLHRTLLARTTIVGIICIALCAAAVVTLLNLGISQLLWPPLRDAPFLTRALRYTLGDFIGIMVLAPLALLWLRRGEESWPPRSVAAIVASLLATLVVGLHATPVSPAIVAANGSLQLLLLLLLPVPAIALTCLLGWRGAAIGVAMVNLMIGLTTPKAAPDAFDAATFAIQQVLAIASVALLLLGARITHFQNQHRLREEDGRNTLHLARRTHASSEMDLRERASHLRRLGDGLDLSLNEMVNWLHAQGHHAVAHSLKHTSEVHSRLFRAQASMIYPAALERLGLYVALQAGGVHEAWNSSHRVSQPRLMGDPCQLSPSLQLAAYRSIVEAVSILLGSETGQLVVRARSGRHAGRRGIVLIAGVLDATGDLARQTVALAGDQLTGRVMAYNGTLHCRRNRIRMVLQEVIDPP